MRIVAAFVMMILVLGCTKYPKEEKEYYPSGEIMSITYWETPEEGIQKTFDPDGNLYQEILIPEGYTKTYYPSGNLKGTGTIINNKPQGMIYEFVDSSDSVILSRSFYQSDSLYFHKEYNIYGQVIGSKLPVSIEMLSPVESIVVGQPVEFRIQLLRSDHTGIALKIGRLKDDKELTGPYYQIFSDSLSVHHKIKPQNAGWNSFEGILLEYDLSYEPGGSTPGDSVLIREFGGKQSFKYRYYVNEGSPIN